MSKNERDQRNFCPYRESDPVCKLGKSKKDKYCFPLSTDLTPQEYLKAVQDITTSCVQAIFPNGTLTYYDPRSTINIPDVTGEGDMDTGGNPSQEYENGRFSDE